jgi:hypothetical protein
LSFGDRRDGDLPQPVRADAGTSELGEAAVGDKIGARRVAAFIGADRTIL